MADNNTLARPYAQALFELAHEAGELDAWSETLDVAADLLADGRVGDYLGNPALDDGERMTFLTGLFETAGATRFSGSDRRGSNFLKLLLAYDRIDVLPEIARHFEQLKARVENTVDVVVTSASRIDGKLEEEIRSALERRLNREVRLTTRIDENLIGGAVIRAGDVVIDGSLKARLEGLASALTR